MTGPSRGAPMRAPYVLRACNICRQKKIRCGGERPSCQSCKTSGLSEDCSWGSEPVKTNTSRGHVQALEKKIEEQRQYIAWLLQKVDKCRIEHNTVIEDFEQPRPSLSFLDGEGTDADNESENDMAERLRTFHLEGQDLQRYGWTSVFQYAPVTPGQHSRFSEIVQDKDRRYVLMVDGEEHQFNPDLNWSRHLPREVYLDRQEHDKLLDLLFKFETSWCLRIVPALFLRDMYRELSLPASHTPPKTVHYSPMLHNALVALAMAFSDKYELRDLKARTRFIEKAKSYIDIECDSPNISVVIALAMIGSFHSSMGEQGLGYLYFGMSGRMSQALGLDVDCSPWVASKTITYDDMQDRYWAYWTTFAQDVCLSLYVGREFCLSTTPDEKVIEIPFVDPDFDQVGWYHPSSGLPMQPGYLSSTFAANCALLRIGRRIMKVIDMLCKPEQEALIYEVGNLDFDLHAWKDGLSKEIEIKSSNRSTLTPHRLMLELTFWWLKILLHRPFYSRSRPGSTETHAKKCDKAARNILEVLAVWKSLYTLRYVPGTDFIQIVFAAGTVFVQAAVQAASGTRVAEIGLRQSIEQTHTCIQYLNEAGGSFQCAKTTVGILGNLLKDELKTTKIASRILVAPGPSANLHILPRSPSVQPAGVENNPPSSDSSHPQQPSSQSHVLATATESSYHVWRLNGFASKPCLPANQPNEGNRPAVPPAPWSFGMGLGMPGGETLSSRPFSSYQISSADQCENQCENQMDFVTTEEPSISAEDLVFLSQTLNQHYPFSGQVDSQGHVRRPF